MFSGFLAQTHGSSGELGSKLNLSLAQVSPIHGVSWIPKSYAAPRPKSAVSECLCKLLSANVMRLKGAKHCKHFIAEIEMFLTPLCSFKICCFVVLGIFSLMDRVCCFKAAPQSSGSSLFEGLERC